MSLANKLFAQAETPNDVDLDVESESDPDADNE
jgi:hypothetical protein